MIYYYSNFIGGFIIGQLLFAAICVFYLQKKTAGLNYRGALNIFIQKEMAAFVVAIVFVTAVMFVMPDFLDLRLTREALASRAQLTALEKAQFYFRAVSLVVGFLAQWIPFIVFKRAIKAANDFTKANNIDTTDTNAPQV